MEQSYLSAYCAGFFDADGSVMIQRVGENYNLTLRVNQTTVPVLNLLRDRYGGKVQGPYARGGNTKPISFWACDAGKAENFLLDTVGFLVVKRERAEVALRFRALFKSPNILPRGPTSQAQPEKTRRILSERAKLYDEMKKLNQRGLICHNQT